MDTISFSKETFLHELSQVTSTVELNQFKASYIGKKGIITNKLKELGKLANEERAAQGKSLNEARAFIDEHIRAQETVLYKNELKKKLAHKKLDITLPGAYLSKKPGGRHPVTLVMTEISEIFIYMGFTIEEGPEIETDYYNFEALNILKNHPARDMQDTFYAENTTTTDTLVLRTHTSPVQIRTMQRRKPPLRFIAPGKVYRCDSDISHTPVFHQIEGLMVDKGISFSNLKAVLEAFIHRVFSPQTPVRFRPSFFPFTEPSSEVDIGCILCAGKGCRVCKGTGWIEVLGAGMVNPQVFKNVGYITDLGDFNYSGFAFGLGMERIAMLKYGIDDIRLFYESDMRFLKQF
ncbi:MAG: phenylalanine--tRNA ligase subunit alpha [Candidatus Magnetoovum sp. WYHC-5]|nr:phenylalanine--tRNA ligase subunit alpha [Candidatus Magnetoovum sp. WYHC-5]